MPFIIRSFSVLQTSSVVLKCPRSFHCVLRWQCVGGLRVKNSWSTWWWIKCRLSVQTPPLRTGCAFLPLEQPSSFQGAFPGSNVEGKGEHVQLKHLFLSSHRVFLFLSFFILFYFLGLTPLVCLGKRQSVATNLWKWLGGKQVKKTAAAVACFFFLSLFSAHSSLCFLTHGY